MCFFQYFSVKNNAVSLLKCVQNAQISIDKKQTIIYNKFRGENMNHIKYLFSLLSALVLSIFSQYGIIFIFVCAVVILDFITGLIKCKYKGVKITSKKAYKGFYKKLALLLALCFGVFFDLFITYSLNKISQFTINFNMPFGLVIGSYIVICECISICENLYTINPDIMPQWIGKLLTGTKNKIKENEQHE